MDIDTYEDAYRLACAYTATPALSRLNEDGECDFLALIVTDAVLRDPLIPPGPDRLLSQLWPAVANRALSREAGSNAMCMAALAQPDTQKMMNLLEFALHFDSKHPLSNQILAGERQIGLDRTLELVRANRNYAHRQLISGELTERPWI